MTDEFHYTWEWSLKSSPEALWPLVADTNRFDRDTGLPGLEQLTPETPLQNGRVKTRFQIFGIPFEYNQDPFEWVYPHYFRVVRHYSVGFIEKLIAHARLFPTEDGGTRLVYQATAKARNAIGLIAIPIQIGILSRRRFGHAFEKYDQLILTGHKLQDSLGSIHFVPGGRARLSKYRESLLKARAAPHLVQKLVETIETVDNLVLSRMRAYEFADYWDEPRREVLEFFLQATRTGLLSFRWDLLCPLCKIAKHTSRSLAELETKVHCDTCKINYTANFDHSVEVTFRLSETIRKIDHHEFCIGGPHNSPHIVVQQLMQPGDEVIIPTKMEAGRHRMRTLEIPGAQPVRVTPTGDSSPTFIADPKGWPNLEREITPDAAVKLENKTEAEQLVILEHLKWSDTATTAAEVTAMQQFRDLFSNEALRPGEEISVGKITVVFTDLQDSTRLYRQIGDAPAFGRVMEHFDVLREIINEENGSIIKTLGDSVMAVFPRPASALYALSSAQEALAKMEIGGEPIRLKVGMHYGHAIAVTLNDRLDYFGSTVNIASRLEQLSSGKDIIISEDIYHDPEVNALFEKEGVFNGQPIFAAIKGYEGEQFNLWCVARETNPGA